MSARILFFTSPNLVHCSYNVHIYIQYIIRSRKLMTSQIPREKNKKSPTAAWTNPPSMTFRSASQHLEDVTPKPGKKWNSHNGPPRSCPGLKVVDKNSSRNRCWIVWVKKYSIKSSKLKQSSYNQQFPDFHLFIHSSKCCFFGNADMVSVLSFETKPGFFKYSRVRKVGIFP